MTGRGLIWLTSYPKSGNTWVRCLLDSLERGGAAPDLERLHARYPWSASRLWLETVTGMPTSDLTPAEMAALRISVHHALAAGDPMTRLAAPGVRCLKVHDLYDPVTFDPAISAGAVYIVRDPRGVAPSWADHRNLPLDAAIEEMGRRDFYVGSTSRQSMPAIGQVFGAWSDHVRSWLDGFPGPLLLLRYEELLARPQQEAERLARFLGLGCDTRMIATAVSACGFENLRAIESRTGFIEREPCQERFFRRGQAHAWRSDLTDAQAAAIINRHGAVMARLGYHDPA